MLVKIFDPNNSGFIYVDEVKKLEVVRGYCRHEKIDDNIIENVKIGKDGKKQTSVVFPTKYNLFPSYKKIDYSNEDVYPVKIIILFFKSSQNEDALTYSMQNNNQVYILNENGKTIDTI